MSRVTCRDRDFYGDSIVDIMIMSLKVMLKDYETITEIFAVIFLFLSSISLATSIISISLSEK